MRNMQELKEKLKAEYDRRLAEIAEQEKLINALPDGCPAPKHIHVISLYGCSASIAFEGDYPNRLEPLEYLPRLVELFPALNLVRTAPGSTFSSIIPDLDTCREIYCRKSAVKGWEPAGKYLFKLNYVEPSGVYGGDLCDLEWYTELAGEVAAIKVDLDAAGSDFIRYSPPRRKHEPWKRIISPRFDQDIKTIVYAGNHGQNSGSVTVYHPDGLGLFDMYPFDDLTASREK